MARSRSDMRARNFSTKRTLDLGVLGELDCGIDFRYYPGHPGSMYRRNGDPGDPPEPTEVEILSVICDGVNITDLAAEIISERDDFMEHVSELYEESTYPEEV